MTVIRIGVSLLIAASVLTLPAYAQLDPPPVDNEQYIPGESFENGRCFVDDPSDCAYALAEWQSQGSHQDIVASCNDCDPEAQGVDSNNQPIYYCFTYGKKEVVAAGIINWVKVVNTGKLLWGIEEPETNCGIQKRCKSICKYDQTGINLFCGKEKEEPFLLSGRFARGVSCP